MKKKTVGLLGLIMILVLFLVTDVFARTGSRRSTIRVYGTTGGAAGDLDAIECEDIRGDDAATTDPLRDDDVAWGIITTAGAHPQIYFWAFDEDVDETNCTGANEPWDFCQGAGAHDGAGNAATLTDSGESYGVDALIGDIVYNTTDGSSCTITDNDATTVTCTLTGGTDNDWDAADAYVIGTFAEDDPRLILPDDIADCTVTANEGAWVLGETYYLGRVAQPSVVLRDADTFDKDDNVKLHAECSDEESGAEDCDLVITVQIAGTPTAVFTIDADGSITSALPLQTTTVEVGHASDTTIARASEGHLTVEGNVIYHAGGDTDVADADVANDITIDLATLATTVTVSDDESTADAHEVVFTTDNTNLESDGTYNYNPSTGTVTATAFAGDVTGAVTGNADTATALAANGADCAAGSYPLGVDASGAVANCTDATTEIDSAIATHAALYMPLTGGTITTNNELYFRDSGLYIYSSAVDILNLVSDGDIYFTAEDETLLFSKTDTDVWGIATTTSVGEVRTASGLVFSFEGGIKLETGANPAQTTEAKIAWDSDDDMLTVGDGSAVRVVAKALKCFPPVILAEPDALQPIADAWQLYYFPAEAYPGGFTVESIHISTSATCTDALNFEEWSNNGTAWSTDSTVEAITLSGTFTEDDGTLADATIAADAYLYVDLPASPTDIASYEITVCGYVINYN